MASFWDNLAEAMGWKKPNNISHYSEIPEEKKQQWRNNYVQSVSQEYEKNNPGRPKIENAKQNGGDPFFTRDDDDFVGEYNSDNDTYETRIYNFKYSAPTNGRGIDTDPSRDFRSGKVLLRVPKDSESTTGGFGSKSPWFDDKRFTGSNIGVYEAILDDGTVLNADQFKDLVQANKYGDFIFGSQEFTDSKAEDRLRAFNEYKDTMKPREYETKWDRNWRGFRPNASALRNTYDLYFKPGPNGE